MSDLQARVHELVWKNWPAPRVKRRFGDTFAEVNALLESGESHAHSNLFRFVYRYLAITEGPQAGFARIEPHMESVPAFERLHILNDYLTYTDRWEELREVLEDAIAAGQSARVAFGFLLALECRTGQLDSARAHLERAANTHATKDRPNLLKFAHMLGMWPLFRALNDQAERLQTIPEIEVEKNRIIERWAHAGGETDFPFDHRIVNLQRASGRRAALTKRYGELGCSPKFFEAVDGTTMSQDEYSYWCPRDYLHFGGVANLQSQMAVWRMLCESEQDHMLIFEDDAWPYADLTNWSHLSDLISAHDPDLVFINERGAGKWWLRDFDQPFVRYSEAFASFDDTMRAPGLDGYLLSKRGAEKLLRNFERNKVVHSIDWQIASYAIDDDELERFPDGVQKGVMETIRERGGPAERLTAFSLNQPIVCQFAAGLGTVAQTNRMRPADGA